MRDAMDTSLLSEASRVYAGDTPIDIDAWNAYADMLARQAIRLPVCDGEDVDPMMDEYVRLMQTYIDPPLPW